MSATSAPTGRYVLLRARIGMTNDAAAAPDVIEQALATAIGDALDELGLQIDLLQLAVAVHPSWRDQGPANRA